MSVQLEIRDGVPQWWLSPDIWVVPGNDPDGAPGRPVAGERAYLWARVTNHGTSNAENATVRFYWANPNVGFDRTTASFVGSAFVTLPPGGQSDVLCLAQWLPSYLNNGHVCILAETSHPNDSLPPSNVFNQATDRRVAQLNLNIAQAGPRELMNGLVEVHNPGSRERRFAIGVYPGRLDDLDANLLAMLGVPLKAIKSGGEVTRFGLVDPQISCPMDEHLERAEQGAEMEIAAGGVGAVRFAAELDGAAALLHVTQHLNDTITGGASYLLLQEGYRNDAITGGASHALFQEA